ncbi:MAG: multiheme c-type cytochrome [Planctomycetota bacterium]|nr:multiheme c-type cytochrome [Planctomycetota bacterium]
MPTKHKQSWWAQPTLRFVHSLAVAVFALALLAWTQLGSPAVAAERERHAVYVGSRVCAPCHDGQHAGNQFTRWYQSKHAKAFTSLAHPEARDIARFSGIPMDPQQSAMCLGCHATAAEAEDWEKDDTFFLRDGVQCEKCHGPGSEHVEAKGEGPRAKLIMPTKQDCLNCHKAKGSHTRVLKSPTVDIEKGWIEISHPTLEDWDHDELQLPAPAVDKQLQPKYAGVVTCAQCHRGADKGYQYSQWRSTKHAEAYVALSTPTGQRIAAEMGVREDPRTSPACLKCHATAYHQPAGGQLDSYTVHEGVSCEACHGPGSGYAPEAVMKDKAAAAAAGLKKITAKTCQSCHANAHGKPFDYDVAVKQIAHPGQPVRYPEPPRYKTPLNLALRPDGKELYVACEASFSVIVLDVATRHKVAEIAVGGLPQDVAFRPDGQRAYVSNRLDDSVSVIDTTTRKVISTIPVGDEPHGLLTDRLGKLLYVLNTSSDDISVIDTETFEEVKRLSASRNPWSLALSPDGSRLCVTNSLSRFVKFRAPAMSEVTVIDTEPAFVDDRVVVPATNLLQGVAWHPSGKYALVTMLRTKNLVPMTRIMQGWTITNGLAIIWADGRVDQVLLDEPGMSFPDPADVAITPDGRLALVTSSGTDRVAVVDLEKMIGLLEKATPQEREKVIPNHLGQATEFVTTHIPTGNCPRGILIAPDGKTAYVACSLDDSITVIDLGELRVVQRIDLGGPPEITQVRRGERLFHSANIAFRRQLSCHSCHPDGHVDGLTYDIEEDGPGGGIGRDPVDNRTLRGILDTAPFKWSGVNPDLSRQCGARLAAFFTRIQPFTPAELDAVDTYVCTIPRPPNRYRPVGAPLTETQRRGKAVFERTRTNDGRDIPKENRCVTCHFPPLYTDRNLRDVGSQGRLDSHNKFDVPHLNNIYDSAPYLHHGVADTLEEIWTKYNPRDTHGATNDMTKDQLNDLVEYLKTL